MKHLLFIVFLIIGQVVLGQSFEGEIRYSIEYLEIPQQLASFKKNLPTEEVLHIKGDKVRHEGATAFGARFVKVKEFDKNDMFILWDHAGNLLHIDLTAEEFKADQNGGPDVYLSPSAESKMIFGYDCSKATFTYPGDSRSSYYVFYTTSINWKALNLIKGVPGLPLEFVYNNQGMVMRVTATSIKSIPQKDAYFQVPSNYTTMNLSEFNLYLNELGSDYVD